MVLISFSHDREKEGLDKRASLRALIMVFFKLGEGLVSVFFGLKDETMVLLDFGGDSCVEEASRSLSLRLIC
ncbi:MAG TPA: hypothetical protein VFG09_03985 [Thermodesulfovibrionales bacterium]|nr:hypothetical protein [Thermodesulfovibrionales bacterium]